MDIMLVHKGMTMKKQHKSDHLQGKEKDPRGNYHCHLDLGLPTSTNVEK